ncbi:MAG: hypothetical protein KDC85_19005 [Saprospiraceae bacterium]|nr:hypothetical protein [Saprospiraceae bacterium]MCB9326949.1 hypothetical protein [Lewinellaceae bacterium]
MNRMTQNPYNFLWGFVPILMALALFFIADSFIDVQIFETYYAVSTFHTAVIFSMYLVFAGLLYWLFRKVKLIHWMTIVHVVLSILMPAGVLFLSRAVLKEDPAPVNGTLLVLFSLVWVFSQLLFLINLVMGAIRKE